MTFSPFGLDLFGDPITAVNRGVLAQRFEFPPFSVLDARSGEWQERKRAWLALGIESEIGRDSNALGLSSQCEDYRKREGEYEDTSISRRVAPGGGGGGAWLGGPRTRSSEAFGHTTPNRANGTSVFDPVLCELVSRWFCPAGGQVVDPFAGGSVRGIVASLLGLRYWGCDLRPEQITANEAQREAICPETTDRLTWVCGDALDVLSTAPEADLVFTCPPYGDLERYSDDPRDLSTMEYHAFLAALRRVLLRAAARLRPWGYAAVVVGDFRDRRTGHYRGFVADTIHAFRDVGLPLYNDAVLLTALGSLPIRIGKQFEAGRKLGKAHQNVLVFVKPVRQATP